MSENIGMSCETVKDRLLAAFLNEGSSEREEEGLKLAVELLTENPKVFEGSAFEILVSLMIDGVSCIDKLAELMMDKNPAGYVNAIFKAADRCKIPYIKFSLVRAVFRRYPGRYRPYILALGRELLAHPADEHTAEVTLWLVQKFGAELVPDLVTFMEGGAASADKIKILQGAVAQMGVGAMSIVTAAADSSDAELAAAGLESLKRLGNN